LADKYFNNIEQIRVTELLSTGAADPSATAKSSTVPKELSVSYVYEEGEELVQRGGGANVCTLTEEDEPKGADLDLTLATAEYEVKQVIAGGDLKTSGPDTTGWEFPAATPGPFKLEAWIPKYDTTSSIEGKVDGYLKVTCNFCKGRVAEATAADREWLEDKFTIKARQNPSSGDPAYEEEEVAAIV
jgi:hypothetical protein